MSYLLFHGIDAAAQSAPERQAIGFPDQALTYGDLSARSNALANFLVDAGVRRGDRVGIFAEKSLDTATQIHGIMKAGGAYVPIDPTSSPDRVAFLLRDCGIRHLVTAYSKLRTLRAVARYEPEDAGIDLACVIGLEADCGLPYRCVPWSEVLTAPAHAPPAVNIIEMDLAYIIYTSGSTGEPKGIMHNHHSGLSFARWAVDIFEIREADRLSNHAPLHFDLSTLDFFAAAVAGATTVIVPEAYTKLPASYSKLLQDQKITVFYTVPFALIQILNAGLLEERDLRALRLIIFAGEPFPPKHLLALMERLPHVRFDNFYGPAEVNGVTYYRVPKTGAPIERIPIGEMAATAEFLVVDGDDRPLEQGEAGELLVRSPTMMQGYWARPDLNARAFYRRPVSPSYEHVFYRTGDLVRQLKDGNFDFLGRKDRQIKVRGYRVELDAVEAALASYQEVEEAAAFAVPDGDEMQRIECAVTLKAGRPACHTELMRYLKTKLAPYALPAKVSIRDDFPRTATGKIDRRQLRMEAMGLGEEST